MKKYTANEIANIIEATDELMQLAEPSIKDVYIAVLAIINILEAILPDALGAYQDIHFGQTVLRKHYQEYNAYSKYAYSVKECEARYEFGRFCNCYFPWFQTAPMATTDKREDVISKTLTSDKVPDFWYDILEHRDEGIADAIRIKQSLCAEKVRKINLVK